MRIFKLIDTAEPELPPVFDVIAATNGKTGATMTVSATSSPANPVVEYHRDFGDGVGLDGPEVTHAYTQPGAYKLQSTATGLDAITNSKRVKVTVTGEVPTTFVPPEKEQLVN